jgi:hypothetical protein
MKLEERVARQAERRGDDTITLTAALKWARLMELRGIRSAEWEKEQQGIVSSVAPSLEYLHRLLMRRAQVYIAGWLGWLCDLDHPLLSEPVRRSLLLAWLPWAGRAPPVEPEVTPRQ